MVVDIGVYNLGFGLHTELNKLSMFLLHGLKCICSLRKVLIDINFHLSPFSFI